MSGFIFVLVILYSISLGLFMFEVIKHNKSLGRLAYRLLCIGAILQTILFSFNMIVRDRFPLLTLYGVLSFYSLILIILTILVHHILKWKLLNIIIIFLSQIILIGALITGQAQPTIHRAFLSKLLYVHISLAIISYTAFALSAIFSLLYLVNDHLLKKRIWNRFTKALPSLESLEKNAFFANVSGVTLLFCGLIVGSIWANLFFGWRFFLDPKVLISFVILIMYGFAIIKRYNKTWTNKQLAYWNAISFLMVFINLIGEKIFQSFHRFL